MGVREKIEEVFKKQRKEESFSKQIGALGIKVLSDKKLENRTELVNSLHIEFERPIEEVLQDDYKIPLEAQTPFDRLKVMRDRLLLLNRLMKLISVPYGRGGSESVYREIMFGWELLYSIASDIIDTCENIIKSTEVERRGTAEATIITESDYEKMALKLFEIMQGGMIQFHEAFNQVMGMNDKNSSSSTLFTLKINIEELLRKLESFLKIEVYMYGFLVMDSSYFREDVAPAYATVIETWNQGISPFSPGVKPSLGDRENE